MKNYDDIINLERPEPIYPRMTRYNRAAQFASFAALSGFEEEVEETARRTDEFVEVDEESKMNINSTLNKLKLEIKKHPPVRVTYFVKDKKKSGGKYITIERNLKLIDEVNRYIKFTTNEILYIDKIIDIIIM